MANTITAVTAIITAIGGLATAVKALAHSIQTRKQVTGTSSSGDPVKPG